MHKDLLKRVGMLTAATAICTAGAFGALALNGLRYMRPTADNWWLLPYAEPAERIEQAVTDFHDSSAPSYTITGYDAQNREIWSYTTFGRLTLVDGTRHVYTGNTEAQYNWGKGRPATVWQYDKDGRLVRVEGSDGNVQTYTYQGDGVGQYLQETYDAQGNVLDRSTIKTDPVTGNTIRIYETYTDEGTDILWGTIDTHGNTIKTELTCADGTEETYIYQWTYDDAAHMATCVNGQSGMTEHHWYDEQGRSIKDTWSNEYGTQEYTTTYTDVTR